MNDATEQSIETITSIAARVAEALEAAAVEHGEAAMDLALMAYQVQAIKTIVIGLALIAPALLTKKFISWLFRLTPDYEEEGHQFVFRVLGSIAYCGPSLIMFIIGIYGYLISPVTWIAALGNPELFIATKALQAAGLL